MKDNRAPKDIGILIRVSSEDQAKGESPAHHLERAKDYAASRGWTVKEVYDLAGISGKSVEEHPEASADAGGHQTPPHHRHHLFQARQANPQHQGAFGIFRILP